MNKSDVIVMPFAVNTAEKNMSIDNDMLMKCVSIPHLTIIRFYGWSSPSLSLGYTQDTEGIDTLYCKDQGIEIVKRPTGGNAVFHDMELTYAVSSSDTDMFKGGILSVYKVINEAIISGLSHIGVDAYMNDASNNFLRGEPFCFQSLFACDIMANGKKIAGGAQRRLKGAFLQHGSILINIDRETVSKIFNKKIENVTSIREETGIVISAPVLAKEIERAFMERFG